MRYADGESLDDLMPGRSQPFVKQPGERWASVTTFKSWGWHLGNIARCAPKENACCHPPVLPKCVVRDGVQVVTVNDYLATTRNGWGASTDSWACGGASSQPNEPDATPRRVRRGHHVWDQQRVRVRLPPRQYGVVQGRDIPEATILPLLTKWTRSSLMRLEHR